MKKDPTRSGESHVREESPDEEQLEQPEECSLSVPIQQEKVTWLVEQGLVEEESSL